DFGERAPEQRIEKDGGVVETARPSWGWRDRAFDRPARSEGDSGGAGDGDDADEACGAGGHAALAEPIVDERKLLRICRVGAAEAGGFDARRASELVDGEARVLGNRGQA